MRTIRAAWRGLLVGAIATVSLAFASSASAASFIVLYKANSVPASAKGDVEKAGGTFVYGYDAIGVAVARSDSASFASQMVKDSRIEGVSSTAGFASRLNDPGGDASGPPSGDLPNAPAADADSLSALQWDMRQIHAPEAHAI